MSIVTRPSHVYVDHKRCIRCDLCEEYAPGILSKDVPVAARESVLDAMAACPTGAIRWFEREEEE